MNYLSISDAEKKWNISRRRLQQLCKSGAVNGARKEGRSWLIPEDADFSQKRSVKSRTGRLPLPVGVSGYIETVSNYYYVDKTLLIRDILDDLPKVSLFTRPRRFGKTLNMDMLRVFFEKTEQDNSVYFKDKAIWTCGDYYRSFQGKYPVIYLTFKDIKYNSWENARMAIAQNIGFEYRRHSLLANSSKCDNSDKINYKKIVEEAANEVELSNSLLLLSSMLTKHYGVGTVIILDEYDTPIRQGYSNGYYDEVIGFIRNLFSAAFKDNPNLAYGFLTGILRVAKESIFSGMNNLVVNSVLTNRYSGYFGFTPEEVQTMASYYHAADKYSEICEWYDGYLFGRSEIFNPWSVINYFRAECEPGAYWTSTGSNEIIGDILSKATPEITENLRKFMQGEPVAALIDTGVIYPEVLENPQSIYSFLLMAGYLKITEKTLMPDGNYMYKVCIPNKEIALVYAKEILGRLKTPEAESTAFAISQAIYEKNTEKLKAGIEKYLLQTISVYDTGSEAFYQGLMLGLCAILNNRYQVRSNRESGLGRFDIQLYPLTEDLPGFIFELKHTKDEKEDLDQLANDALAQIDEKKYDAEMAESGIKEIIKVGIAFHGKNVSVKS
ncbi:MAG: AAA family ATPase [Flexilinea sp.]|nr:AAA family ATPase [Flexilinea sp.]